MSYDVNTMDALIVSIQMILVGKIIHPAKPFMYSLLLENQPTSIYSHLTRNTQQEWVDVGFARNFFPAKPTFTHTYCFGRFFHQIMTRKNRSQPAD